ncbi:hypothetical protein BP5796_07435 [Coleophoma crateriformis]|uniref:RING-type E3 ubiquitin transferase n=1 Tax=Coleophoma crateriformis TaxID=565419 RepID=A0A3D8RIW8_9HELO|nr:hypothetical protein BP5796_07435 [Coleophoma crateriformis]
MSNGGESSQMGADSQTLSQESTFSAARLPAFGALISPPKDTSDDHEGSPQSLEYTQQLGAADDSQPSVPEASTAPINQSTQQSVETQCSSGSPSVVASAPVDDNGNNVGNGERDTQQEGDTRSRGDSDGSAMSLLTALASQEQPDPTQSSTSSSRPAARTRPSTDIVRARWQPDAEVTYCPICHTQFGWVFRKHHCRKCGRVVCGSCSQHRITIPYEYIARPPTYLIDEDFLALDRYRTGGERVRLCNPCVPDPNIAPPQVPSSQEPLHRRASERSQGSVSGSSNGAISNRRQNRSSMFVEHYSSRPRQPSITGMSANQDGNRSRSSTMPTREADSRNNNNPSSIRRMEPRNAQVNYRQFINADPRSSDSNYRHLLNDDSRPLPNLPRPTEDDICPVCHKLLPARSLPDFEEQRATHISSCIEAHTTSNYASHNRPGAYTSNSHPAPTPSSSMPGNSRSSLRRNPTPPVVIPSSSRAPQITPNTPEARMAAREQAHAAVVLGASQTPPIDPGRQTRLFPYKATEKDCVDDAECTICLEEFEVGADMARLECFCRFHLHCIRGWWVNHHGRCPVHQHDGFGF